MPRTTRPRSRPASRPTSVRIPAKPAKAKKVQLPKRLQKQKLPKSLQYKPKAVKNRVTAVRVVKPASRARLGVRAKAVQAVPTAEASGPKKTPASSRSGPAGMPQEGELAPDFVLPDQDGHTFQLSKLRGSPVVLYFYPKDDTPGCTIEAREFSRDIEEFRKRGIVVFGVSKDTPESHCRFIQKYDLQLPLLSDVDASIIRRYGVWKEKNLYGKKVMGTQRATFVIAADGHIMKVFPDVSPQGHSQEILEVFR